jgi:hypothetical protein
VEHKRVLLCDAGSRADIRRKTHALKFSEIREFTNTRSPSELGRGGARKASLTLAVPDLHPTGKKRPLQLKTDNFGFAQWPHFHPVGS